MLYPIPNIRHKSVPYQIACDCGEKTDSIKSEYRYQCKTCVGQANIQGYLTDLSKVFKQQLFTNWSL